MLRTLKWLLSVILLWSLISCAPNPPDVPVFENLQQRLATDPVTGHLLLSPSPNCIKQIQEPECGHGVFIKSGKEVFVGELPAHLYEGKPWSQLKRESIYVPAKESYAPLSAYIIDSCKKMNCDDQVTKFKVKLDSLNGITGAISN